MSLKNKFMLTYVLVMAQAWQVRQVIFGGPLLCLWLVWYATPGLFPFALAAVLIMLIGAPFWVGKMAEAYFMNNRLKQVYEYGPYADAEAIERLEAVLVELGFVSVGLYQMDKTVSKILFHADLKMYAQIYWGLAGQGPLLEYCSFYEGERSYGVTNMNIRPNSLFPDALVLDSFPGKNPAELLDIFLAKRPDQGLLESTVEKIPEYYEMELRLARAHCWPDRTF